MSELEIDPENPTRIVARVVEGPRVEVSPEDQLRFDKVDLVGEDFSGQAPKVFEAVGSRFRRCRFERTRIGADDEFRPSFGSGTKRSEYVDCSFDGSYIRRPLGYARFVRCSFRDVELVEWGTVEELEFIDCVFTGVADDVAFYGKRERLGGFGGAVLGKRLGYARNEFHGNDFAGMDLRYVDFRMGIDLTEQVLPADDDYVVVPDARAAIERVRPLIKRWEDPREREQALGELGLGLLEQEVEDGKVQLFFRLSERTSTRPAYGKLYELLADVAKESSNG